MIVEIAGMGVAQQPRNHLRLQCAHKRINGTSGTALEERGTDIAHFGVGMLLRVQHA